ncbi:MAG: putative ABC transporter permease [Clostridia bacterium]
MIYLFGSFWWDYSAKPFNYKGILCLESTLAWGVLAIVIVNFFHGFLVRTVASIIPRDHHGCGHCANTLWYAIDFGVSVRQVLREE